MKQFTPIQLETILNCLEIAKRYGTPPSDFSFIRTQLEQELLKKTVRTR